MAFGQINILSNMSAVAQHHLERMAMRANFSRGQYLYLPGEPSESVFILKEGRVKLTLISEQGREFTIAFLSPGELFGELALGDEGRRTSAAMAMEETQVSIIGRSDFESFLANKPDLLSQVTRLIGVRRQQLESRLADLAFRKVPGRMAGILLRLADEFGETGPQGLRLKLQLNHQEIANLVGASREMATITLNKMQRANVLRYEKKHIIILDRSALERMI